MKRKQLQRRDSPLVQPAPGKGEPGRGPAWWARREPHRTTPHRHQTRTVTPRDTQTRGRPQREQQRSPGPRRCRPGREGACGRVRLRARECVCACERGCACARAAADTAGQAQGPGGRKRGPLRRRPQEDQAEDAAPAAPGAPGASIWKKVFWMTELANNSVFCFSCLGTSHYRARRRKRGAGEAGRRGRSKTEQRKSLGKEAGKKVSQTQFFS